MPIHPMWEPFPEIKHDLAETYDVIEKKVRIRNKDIQQTINDLLALCQLMLVKKIQRIKSIHMIPRGTLL